MDPVGKKNVSRSHTYFSLIISKVYQESHKEQKAVNEAINGVILITSSDTGALYGVKACVEIEFRKGMIVKGDNLDVLQKRLNALDQENCKLLL